MTDNSSQRLGATGRSPCLCIEKWVPANLFLEAAERALRENPSNAISGGLTGFGRGTIETFGAAITGKKWLNGRVIAVRHLDGDAATHRRVEACVAAWEEHANIRFDFGDHEVSDIRISYFHDNQSWSYVGTDALVFTEQKETMHFGWLHPDTDDAEVRRVVLHEFGHVLGLTHEHQHPSNPIPWNREAVYEHYVKKLGWTEERVDDFLFKRQNQCDTQFDTYDEKSIMHYPIPPELTMTGKAVGMNCDLSDTDKKFIRRLYPRTARPHH